MDVHPSGPTARGPGNWFSGEVWIDPITSGHGPAPLSLGSVHFAPGARTGPGSGGCGSGGRRGWVVYAYLPQSRVLPTDADGAGNALQAWDMLHGNVLLSG